MRAPAHRDGCLDEVARWPRRQCRGETERRKGMAASALLELHRTGTRGLAKNEEKETQRHRVRREEAKMSWRHFMSDAGETEVQVGMLMRWRVPELWGSEKPRPLEPQGKRAAALQRNRMEAEASERVVEFVYGNDVGRKR